MTTCVPATISWIYEPVTDPGAMDLTLSITNANVPQISTTEGSALSPINQSLTGGLINAATETYIWATVNVTEGWYAIVATIPSQVGTSVKSLAFYVVTGADTSCLKSLAASTTPSTSSGSLTSSVDFPSSSETQSSDNAPSEFNSRALVGGLLGGVGLLAVITAAYLCFWYLGTCRRPSRKRANRRWLGVHSVNSKHRAYLRNSQVVRGHSFDSFGGILPEDGYVLDIGRTSGEEDNEKAESSESSSQFHGAPLAPQSTFLDRQYSSDVDQTVPSPLPSGASSHPNSQYSAMTTSTTTTDSNFSHNLSSTFVYPQLSYPPSPLPAFPSGTSLEIAGGASSTAGSAAGEQHTSTSAPGERRVPRKPVPQYNSTDPSLTPPPPAVAPQFPGFSNSHWLNRGQQHTGPGFMTPPVYYLIPDMPPPAD